MARSRRRQGLLALLALLACAPSAQAYERERPAEPMVQGLVPMAVAFWQTRGVQPCAGIRAMQAPSLLDTDGVDATGRADTAACTLWVADRDVRAALRERWTPYTSGGDSRRDELCTTVFHEVGHLAKLEHFGNGLMSPSASRIPFECKVWANALERAERQALVSRRHFR